MLTPYGRGASEAFISSWAKEGEGSFGYGALKIPDWIDFGGDQRSVVITTGTSKEQNTYIPMQIDTEVALKPIPGLTLDGSVGSYGPDHSVEHRRLYAKVDLSPSLSFRAGRFLPGFGVNLPDHTTNTREALGFGEGSETYNIETALVGQYGESILTFIDGTDTNIKGSQQGVKWNTNSMTGAAWRTAAYLGSNAQVGVSYLGVSNWDDYRQAYGTFVQSGILTKGYVLGEYDRMFTNGNSLDVALLKFGYEITQGLMATVQGDFQDPGSDGRVGLQWWPRPHWELIAEFRRTYPDSKQDIFVDSGILMLHHYL